MPTAKTQGIVLRTLKYGDSSRICTLYTRDFGKVKVIAKGARALKSRFGAGLSLFVVNQVVFSYREARELQTLTGCELVREHRGFETEPLRLAHAGVAAELVDRVAVGEEPRGELFELLRETLTRMDETGVERLPLALWFFALQLVSLLGYRPRLDGCAGCGAVASAARCFGLIEGGLLCSSCGTGRERTVQLSPGAVEILRLLARAEWDPAAKLRPLRAQAGEVEATLLAYLQAQAVGARKLRSMEFLRAMRRRAAAGAGQAPGRRDGPGGAG